MNGSRYSGMEINVGENIRKLRTERKVSVASIAKKLNKKRQTIYQYEKSKNVGMHILAELAEIMDVDVLWFLTGDEQYKEQQGGGLSYTELMQKYIKALEKNIELEQRLKMYEK